MAGIADLMYMPLFIMSLRTYNKGNKGKCKEGDIAGY
jgi:hypothetical protein